MHSFVFKIFQLLCSTSLQAQTFADTVLLAAELADGACSCNFEVNDVLCVQFGTLHLPPLISYVSGYQKTKQINLQVSYVCGLQEMQISKIVQFFTRKTAKKYTYIHYLAKIVLPDDLVSLQNVLLGISNIKDFSSKHFPLFSQCFCCA